MPRAKSESEKFRAFLAGKGLAELQAMSELIQLAIAIVSPVVAKPKRRKVQQQEPAA